MKIYIFQFLFFFVFISAFMFGGTSLVGIWPDDARLGLSVAFGLGSASAHVVTSIVADHKRKKNK